MGRDDDGGEIGLFGEHVGQGKQEVGFQVPTLMRSLLECWIDVRACWDTLIVVLRFGRLRDDVEGR